MRILIATDAWRPQVNGVVRTYENLQRELEALGHRVTMISPSNFVTLPCPGYREIRLALPGMSFITERVLRSGVDHVHIATEGPIGWATRSICLRNDVRFTTSFHTRFPEYIEAYTRVPARISYAIQRHFHSRAIGTLVATPSLKDELTRRGFGRLMLWPRGVDMAQFHPCPSRTPGPNQPTFLYVGRVSREKNVQAFLDLDLPGRKVVVGDGPLLPALRRRYPGVAFKGAKTGDELAAEYSAADVFVFPSRTDTFGLVLLEAMASGLPIAAYPVTGPIDVIREGVTGFLSTDLQAAALAALSLDSSVVRAEAMRHNWSSVALGFLAIVQNAQRAAGFSKLTTKVTGQSPRIKQSQKAIS
jgi:glycosyltransferase involved in cell wall biosynthesis